MRFGITVASSPEKIHLYLNARHISICQARRSSPQNFLKISTTMGVLSVSCEINKQQILVNSSLAMAMQNHDLNRGNTGINTKNSVIYSSEEPSLTQGLTFFPHQGSVSVGLLTSVNLLPEWGHGRVRLSRSQHSNLEIYFTGSALCLLISH